MTFQEMIPLLVEGLGVRGVNWFPGYYIKFTRHKDPYYKDPVS